MTSAYRVKFRSESILNSSFIWTTLIQHTAAFGLLSWCLTDIDATMIIVRWNTSRRLSLQCISFQSPVRTGGYIPAPNWTMHGFHGLGGTNRGYHSVSASIERKSMAMRHPRRDIPLCRAIEARYPRVWLPSPLISSGCVLAKLWISCYTGAASGTSIYININHNIINIINQISNQCNIWCAYFMLYMYAGFNVNNCMSQLIWSTLTHSLCCHFGL